MNRFDITRQLEEIATSGDDFEWQSGQLTEKWENEPKSLEEIVEPILQFMERHPEIEYGTPGPLVHLVETFLNYEEKVIESVERRPTRQTAWMLNRMINGEQDQHERDVLISVLKRVLENPAADPLTRDTVSDYLEFQARKWSSRP
jgi:hypothetical protein